MDLPPQQNYGSKEALFTSINAWAMARGYAFISRRSTKEKNGKYTITYACDRSCLPPSKNDQQRKTTSRGTGCPFSIIGKEAFDGSWTLKHRPNQEFSLHNHEPSQHPSAHPVHRQLSGDTSHLGSLSKAGIAPKEIQTIMRQGGSLATRQDIYNQIADVRRDAYQGQSSIHALANQLDSEGFWSRVQYDADGRVTAVLFAHPDSLGYLKAYPEVLLLDCTYKTNKYGMPLLDMIGIDACQRSFCIAFAFLSGETETDYIWALSRLKSLYGQCDAALPSIILTDRCLACINASSTLFLSSTILICIWHANKAVLTRCQPAFSASEEWKEFYGFWFSIINSSTKREYYDRLQHFEQKYHSEYLDQVGYIKTTWLIPFKEKIVKAWVDQATHFGNTATSRVEGIHALLKTYLKQSTFDLFDAWKAIQLALLNQLSELQSNQAQQQLRFPIGLSNTLYGVVRGWVSHEALRKVEEQRRLCFKDGQLACTGVFSRVYGLPCVHILESLEGSLLLSHFHSHWHFKRDGAPQLLLEPRQCIEPKPVQPQSSLPRSSTKRGASQFELVESQARRAPSRCSKCREIGHTMSSKACPLRYSDI